MNKNYYLLRREKQQRDQQELEIYRALNEIDARLKALDEFRSVYPPHRADDEQPCAVHISAPTSVATEF